jgi:pyruvate formate lyase activating enzyme
MVERSELEPGTVRGEWHSPTASSGVRCDLCPRNCTLRDGQRGFCFVRERRDDDIVLTSYRSASGAVPADRNAETASRPPRALLQELIDEVFDREGPHGRA